MPPIDVTAKAHENVPSPEARLVGRAARAHAREEHAFLSLGRPRHVGDRAEGRAEATRLALARGGGVALERETTPEVRRVAREVLGDPRHLRHPTGVQPVHAVARPVVVGVHAREEVERGDPGLEEGPPVCAAEATSGRAHAVDVSCVARARE